MVFLWDIIITVLVGHMTGTDRRKLLVIGKSKSPRCFTSLPVLYKKNAQSLDDLVNFRGNSA